MTLALNIVQLTTAFDVWAILSDGSHSRSLFVKQAETLESDSSITLSDMEKYRRLGPLGQLHNFVAYIGHTVPFPSGASRSPSQSLSRTSYRSEGSYLPPSSYYSPGSTRTTSKALS
jgi:hypothetical protein